MWKYGYTKILQFLQTPLTNSKHYQLFGDLKVESRVIYSTAFDLQPNLYKL